MQDQHALAVSRDSYSEKAQCRADADGDEPQLPPYVCGYQVRHSLL
jgi:hypothetical protein